MPWTRALVARFRSGRQRGEIRMLRCGSSFRPSRIPKLIAPAPCAACPTRSVYPLRWRLAWCFQSAHAAWNAPVPGCARQQAHPVSSRWPRPEPAAVALSGRPTPQRLDVCWLRRCAASRGGGEMPLQHIACAPRGLSIRAVAEHLSELAQLAPGDAHVHADPHVRPHLRLGAG
jgi:hypothetical protein